jgi:predicted nucleotidyltransferase
MGNLKPNERAALAELKSGLARQFKLVELRLFGSKARGDSNSESDIDVLIVLEDCDWETRKAVSALCFETSLEYDVVIIPVVYTRAKRDSPFTRATPFYLSVAREGVPV